MKLFTAGTLAFAGAWTVTALFGGFLAKEGWFALPIAGPIVWASTQRSDAGLLALYMSVFVTLPQLAAAGLMVGGLYDALKKPAPPVTIAPFVGPGLAGLSLGGRF